MKRILFLIVLVSPLWVFGQTGTAPTPAQTLRLARATYEQGRLHEIPSQLDDKVLADMTKQEKVEGYKILCLSYIYLEEPTKADGAMLNILNTDPYFQINPAVDPAEFVALYKTFRRSPIVRVGALLGGNLTQPNIIEVLNTDGGTAEATYKFGLQFGASADLPLNFLTPQLTLHGDLLYQQKKFEMVTSLDQGDGDENSTLATETQTWIAFPLSVQYYILKQDPLKVRKYNPYISLGVSSDFLVKDNLTAERTIEGESSIEPKNFNVKDQRESINISGIAAAGVKTRFAGGVIGIEFKYIYGLTEVTNAGKSYENQELYLTYALPNTTFKLNSVSVSVTYLQNIFKPKKITSSK